MGVSDGSLGAFWLLLIRVVLLHCGYSLDTSSEILFLVLSTAFQSSTTASCRQKQIQGKPSPSTGAATLISLSIHHSKTHVSHNH